MERIRPRGEEWKSAGIWMEEEMRGGEQPHGDCGLRQPLFEATDLQCM